MSNLRLSFSSWRDRCDLRCVVYLALLYFVLTTFLEQIYFYLNYRSTLGLRDLAISQQPLHNFITDGTFDISVGQRGHQSVFSEHAFLFLILLVPFYYVFPSPLLLLLSQPLAYLLMIWLARKILRNVYRGDPTTIDLFTILLLISPVYHAALLNRGIYGFHLEYYFPALFLAAYYLYKQGLTGFILVFALSLSIIEYYSVIWIAFSLHNIFIARHVGRLRLNWFVFSLSAAYLVFAYLVFIPHFRGTSLPWYGASASTLVGGGSHIDIVGLGKALGVNVILNLGIFLFLPLKNFESLLLILPVYLLYMVGYVAGYADPLSPISWHANALYPSILIGYMKEIFKVDRWTVKHRLLRMSCLVAVVFAAVLQFSTAYNYRDLYLLATTYPSLKEDFDAIQRIKNEIRNARMLSSFQLGKYFADVKDVNVLENRSDIVNGVKYIIYYGGERVVPVDNEKLKDIAALYSVKAQYKDITVFERTDGNNSTR